MRCEPGTDGIGLVELQVENIGSIFCRGQAVPVGTEAACSIRPDLMQMKPYQSESLELSSPQKNCLTARITAVEMTGYVTRVPLMEEHTAKEILYKARTTDWNTVSAHEGQLVVLQWSPKDCVFLPH
jgi:putative spermidine/putrescine transport system ATP-binding protein